MKSIAAAKSWIYLLSLVLVAGCSRSEPPPAKTDVLTVPLKPTPLKPPLAIPEDLKSPAMAAKDDLFKMLSSRLMGVASNEGPAMAIKVCREEASGFSTKVGQKHALTIGRTSMQLRNSKNTPPAWASEYVESMVEQPTFVSLPDEKFGALLPIRLKAKCLACHGSEEDVSADVKAALANLYPNDQATGIREGDLRGWFWVEVGDK